MAAEQDPSPVSQLTSPTAAFPEPQTPQPALPPLPPDIVLLGCVPEKQSKPAPAGELYVSELFGRRKEYAEKTRKPWYVLSALHGLVDPKDVIAPYDLVLNDQSAAYREDWAEVVVEKLVKVQPFRQGTVIEVHAEAAYLEAIQPLLELAGARVSWPLRDLSLDDQSAWYLAQRPAGRVRSTPGSKSSVSKASTRTKRPPAFTLPTLSVPDAIAYLSTSTNAVSAEGFPWGRSDLDVAGLYTCWVDVEGAAALSRGLGLTVSPGLVYAGLAGAMTPGRRDAGSSLRSRIAGSDLRGGINASTLRKTLAAVLRNELALEFSERDRDLVGPSQEQLSEWMRLHLGLAVYPITSRDQATDAEQQLLAALDPPLNLDQMSETALRTELRRLRRELPSPRRAL